MSEPKDKFDLFTELEEGLRGVYCAIAVLQKLVDLSGDDAPIYDLLASHLELSYEKAHGAYQDLHRQVMGPPRDGNDGSEGEPRRPSR